VSENEYSSSVFLTVVIQNSAWLEQLNYFMKDTLTLEKLKQILLRAKPHGSIEAKYFLMILNALASCGFSPENVFPVLGDLFERKHLSNCRRDLMWVPGYYSSRPLPCELDYRFTCRSYKTCKGFGRKPNVFSPPSGFDDDYFMIDICLLCRFDAVLLWFLTHFSFL